MRALSGAQRGLQDIDQVQNDTGCPGKGGLKEHVHYDAETHLGGKNEVLPLL